MLPSAPSGTLTPFARVSPVGKFTVEVPGLLSRTGVRLSQPAAVAPVTVRLPVTAMAFTGTLMDASPGLRPVTWKVLAAPTSSGPSNPLPVRESRSRFGAMLT